MGPNWLVVVFGFDAESVTTSVAKFTTEEQAREAFDIARKVSGRTVFLAPVRAEAKS